MPRRSRAKFRMHNSGVVALSAKRSPATIWCVIVSIHLHLSRTVQKVVQRSRQINVQKSVHIYICTYTCMYMQQRSEATLFRNALMAIFILSFHIGTTETGKVASGLNLSCSNFFTTWKDSTYRSSQIRGTRTLLNFVQCLEEEAADTNLSMTLPLSGFLCGRSH